MSRGRPYPSSVRAAAGTWLRLARDDDAPFIAEWTHDSAVHRWWGGRELTVEEELHAAGWVPLTVDPALDNTRAIRAWRSAGFVETGEPADDGGVLVQVMTFTP